MNLQFFNPWIGRMNRQQFLLGGAVCVAAITLGTEMIQEPALVVISNVFFGFMLFVFVFRRLSDQRNDSVPHFIDKYAPKEKSFEDTFSDALAKHLAISRLHGSLIIPFPVIAVLVAIMAFPFILLLEKFSVPIQIALALYVTYIMMRPGHPHSNHYGLPPAGMDFHTTIPATYPDALIARFEKIVQEKEQEERDFKDQLIALKTYRKAKKGGSTHFVEFKGRG